MGYLAPRAEPGQRERIRELIAPNGAPLAVVTVGGGADGEALVACYLECARRGLLPRELQSFVVTGPFMSEDAQRRLRACECEGVTFTTFYPGLEQAIAAADVVVSRAGYNTVCEILGAGTPSVVVPRVRDRAEQHIRAECLARRGLVEQVGPESLNPERPGESSARLYPPQTAEPPVASGPPAASIPPGVRERQESAPSPPAGIPQFALARAKVANGLKPFTDGITWLKAHGYRTEAVHADGILDQPGERDHPLRSRIQT